MTKNGRVEKNNTLALKHGAFGKTATIPDELIEELQKVRDFITTQAQVAECDLLIVNMTVDLYRMYRLMHFWAAKTGGEFIIDETGNIFPKACFNNHYIAIINALGRNLDRLGLTPQARQQLGLTEQRKDFISWLNQKEGMKDVKQATDR